MFIIYHRFIADILWNKEVSGQYLDEWFMDMDHRQSGNDLSLWISWAFTVHCSVPFGLADYRHLAAFFVALIREGFKHVLNFLLLFNNTIFIRPC